MKAEEKCKHGWHDGSCCCNCENQLELRKHPWNKEFGKGSISDGCGFVCVAFASEERSAIFSETKHGMCELHCSISPTNN